MRTTLLAADENSGRRIIRSAEKKAIETGK